MPLVAEKLEEHNVLYFAQAPWKVGEREEERDARVASREPVALRDIQPDQFPGKIISVQKCSFSPGETVDPTRAVKTFSLSPENLALAKTRKLRVDGSRLVPVTFDEQHGATARVLKETFPLDFLVREVEEQKAIEDTMERNRLADEEYTTDVTAWIEEAALEAEVGLVLTTPRPVRPEPEDLPEPEFAILSTKLRRALPKTEVHSGAGLYKVDASGTTHDDTIASFNDNLCLQSEDFGTTWVANNAAITPDQAVAPNGKTSADKITDDGANAYVEQSVAGGVFTDNLQYRLSTHAMFGDSADMTLTIRDSSAPANRAKADFEWIAGVLTVKAEDLGTAFVTDEGDGWYRAAIVCPVNVIVGANGHTIKLAPTEDGGGSTGKYMYAWGTQLKEGASQSIYKPTREATDTQITLADLDLTDSGLRGAWLNSAVTGTPDDASLAGDDMTNVGVPVYGTLGEVTLDGDDYLRRAEGDWRIVDNVGTVTARITPDTVNNVSIWASADEGSENRYLSFCLRSTHLAVLSREDGTFNEVRGSTVFVVGEQHDVALVSIGTAWLLYVDGEVETLSVASGANTGGWLDGVTSRDNVTIGAIHRNVIEHYFDGAIKDVRYYDSALSASEVEAISNGGDLTDGERDGEVFVSGGNGYGVVRNGVGSVLVAGDATAEAGAGTISPYTTIQSGADQLFTDQGSTIFALSQYLRVFAGTYTETVTPNASLNPDEASGETLIIEGDPDDDRTNIIVQPTTSYGFNIGVTAGILRHLKVAGASCNQPLVYISGTRFVVRDCVVSGATASSYAAIRFGRLVEDCLIENNGSTRGIYANREMTVRRCVVTQAVADTGIGIALIMDGGAESCVVSGFSEGIWTNNYYGTGNFILRQNTVYDCVNAFKSGQPAVDHWTLVNNIVKDCTYVITLASGGWPEETAVKHGGDFLLRNNCFDYDTAFAYDGTDTKTYAEFAALNLVDASGDLDQTDPLLTDPGSDDFSLQSGSPCKWAGHGSGVTEDYLGTAFDPYHPDIGAWSSGLASVPAAPEITAFVNDATGTSATLTIDAERDTDVTTVRYRLTSETNWTEFGTTLTGDGDLQITGLTVGPYIFEAFSTRTGTDGYSKPSAPILGYVSGDGDEIPDMHDDLARSLVYYLQHERYSARNVSGTLFDHFRDSSRGRADVRIGLGYPEEPVEKLPPCIFLGGMDHRPGTGTIGNQIIIETFSCVFFGYVALESDNTDRKSNKRLRDELQNDVYYLLNRDAEGVDIDFYNFTDEDVPDSGDSWSVRVSQARSRAIDPASHVDSNRFMFEVSFDVFVLTTR